MLLRDCIETRNSLEQEKRLLEDASRWVSETTCAGAGHCDFKVASNPRVGARAANDRVLAFLIARDSDVGVGAADRDRTLTGFCSAIRV